MATTVMPNTAAIPSHGIPWRVRFAVALFPSKGLW